MPFNGTVWLLKLLLFFGDDDNKMITISDKKMILCTLSFSVLWLLRGYSGGDGGAFHHGRKLEDEDE